jgi:hypothetical protein
VETPTPWEPGWHSDPWDARHVRWWDGERWTASVRRYPVGWLSARWTFVDRLTAGFLITVVAAAVVVGILSLSDGVFGLSGVLSSATGDILVLLAVLVVIPSTVRAVWLARQTLWRWWDQKAGLFSRSGVRFWLRGTMSPVAGGVLLACVIFGVVLTTTASSSGPPGNPSPARSGCRWPIVDHNNVVCVSQPVYHRLQLGDQESFDGAVLILGAVDAAIVGDSLVRRRVNQAIPPP